MIPTIALSSAGVTDFRDDLEAGSDARLALDFDFERD